MKTIEANGKIYKTCGLEELILLKKTVLLKAIYKFIAILIKILMVFFTELE